MQNDWLIIGGGIHGVHIAARLVGEANVPVHRLQIIDPGEILLERWRACTATTGMTHLRSPSVHNLDLNPWSMMRYAKRRHRREPGTFALPFNRPKLQFFNEHCDKVIREFRLDKAHVRARATSCTLNCDGVTVRLSSGSEISASNVVLAIGSGDQPEMPDWAPKDHPRVHHIFASDFDGWPSIAETIAVVGGGISAAQVALRLVEEGHEVYMVSRHALREHQFDSEPGWLGPKLMAGFQRETNVDRRRTMITAARHKGSMPPGVRRALQAAINRDEIHWHQDSVHALDVQDSELRLHFAEQNPIVVDRVLLATGFTAHRPGGAFIDELIKSASLPCASCGYPIVDRTLRWHPRVYVSGPLAELELGPTSRNISGARRAAERLVAAVRSGDLGAAQTVN